MVFPLFLFAIAALSPWHLRALVPWHSPALLCGYLGTLLPGNCFTPGNSYTKAFLAGNYLALSAGN